jgi:hypothetical protein
MSTPFADQDPRNRRPGPFRGEVPEGFDMGQRMGRMTLLTCLECGASVTPELTETHTAWHAQMAALLAPPAEGDGA